MKPLKGTTVVIGAQWGDEGKGKIVDYLAKDADVVVRFNGGANAGHTLVVNDKKTTLHLLPSGILRSGKMNIMGPGVVCDPETLYEELIISCTHRSKVLLDQDTPVILPLHKQIDALREKQSGKSAIGTTGRGIGPCYEDFVARRGVRLKDMIFEDQFRSALTARNFYQERSELLLRGGVTPMNADELALWRAKYAGLRAYLGDTRADVHKAIHADKSVLFEGAQGVMLDVYHGTYPYCTSSCCTAAGVSATMGIYKFDRVIGVAKAYVTRVGNGPFPTKINDEVGKTLQERGHEFGSTTGRPRDVGWLDLPSLKYACRVGGITELVITKLDVLTGLKWINICAAFLDRNHDFAELHTLNRDALEMATPEYLAFPGWSEPLDKCRRYEELPTKARAYLKYIQDSLGDGVRIVGVGVGPERDAVIWMN